MIVLQNILSLLGLREVGNTKEKVPCKQVHKSTRKPKTKHRSYGRQHANKEDGFSSNAIRQSVPVKDSCNNYGRPACPQITVQMSEKEDGKDVWMATLTITPR